MGRKQKRGDTIWLYTPQGFYSAVCGRQKTADGYTGPINKHVIVVRARCRDHLEALLEHHDRLFFDAEIIDTPDRDYPHRIVTDDVTWGMFLTALAAEMDYDNFKEAAGRMVHDPKYAYDERLHDVWVMMDEVIHPEDWVTEEGRRERNEAKKFSFQKKLRYEFRTPREAGEIIASLQGQIEHLRKAKKMKIFE